ncbi:MAG TPA: multicopper oxidase family protein [Candidatus Elarobacter sp.]|nr:multicopper oxidase family protein [Candidatus Elarobacter sp.]
MSILNAPDLPAIPEVTSSGGVASVALIGRLDDAGRPAFFWQGQEIAPTIRVRPGDTIRVHYENELPVTCGFGMASDSNLHFHGLSVAPSAPGDDVLATTVRPGASYDYTVRIDRDQPPGLYWYHPHPHGLTNWEIGNGMAGTIVVEGIADAVAGVAGLRERVIVLRDVPHDPSLAAALATDAKRGPIAAGVATRDQDDQYAAPCGVETTSQTTINGIPAATLGIRPGERQLWRVLNASAHRHFDLQVPGVPVQLVARDGVPLDDYPGARPSEQRWHVMIPPGGRAEFVIAGPPHPQMLYSLCYDTGPTGDENPGAILGELDDDNGSGATARVAPPNASGGFAARPPQAVPGKQSALVAPPPPAASRVVRLSEDARRFYINGVAYRPGQAPLFTARSGTTERWTIENASLEVHVFHLHQVHFVVESTNGKVNRDRHWVDIADVPPGVAGSGGRIRPSRIVVLVDFRDPSVRGTFPFHCHMADHEDNGMMATIRVI